MWHEGLIGACLPEAVCQWICELGQGYLEPLFCRDCNVESYLCLCELNSFNCFQTVSLFQAG